VDMLRCNKMGSMFMFRQFVVCRRSRLLENLGIEARTEYRDVPLQSGGGIVTNKTARTASGKEHEHRIGLQLSDLGQCRIEVQFRKGNIDFLADPATGIVQAFLEAGDGLDPEAVAPGDGDHVPVAALGRYLPHRPGDLPGAERGTENVRRTALPGGRIESCIGDDQRYVTIAHSPYGHDADIR